MKFWKKPHYDLSIIIIFYNMRREAQRTLYSLTRTYQKNIENISYEVIVIDNGSNKPLDENYVNSFGKNFRYVYFDTSIPSPSKALNFGAQIAASNLITLCIDGARILSPKILYYTMLASKIHKKPFIYTLGMHLGYKPQNYLVDENYSQKDEDALLSSIAWQQDGYLLFEISSVALSSKQGYFSKLTESNCITMSRSMFLQMGGFDERFTSAGGGLTNLDFFNRANEIDDIEPILLLGEATFHQFHGGTATNIPLRENRWEKMEEEYISIRGKSYYSFYKEPIYFGKIHSKCHHLLKDPKANE